MTRWLFAISTILATLSAVDSGRTEEYGPAKPIAGAENRLDVVYLPHRVTGQWQDRWLKMNVHWPADLAAGQRRACILFVHGGGYGGGDKDASFCKQAMQRAIAQGFVVANMNYILGRDIFPQVYYDFDTAVRLLRANAAEFHIDPDRIGAWGFSAGGWLASSGAFTDAGDLFAGHRRAVSEAWPLDDARRHEILARVNKPRSGERVPVLVPMDDPQPAHAEFSSRIQALQGDFTHFEDNITSAAPAICTYVGKGGTSKMREPAESAGVDYLELELVHPKKKFDGAASVHVPPLDMLVPAADGRTQIELQDRVVAWFKQKLIDNAAAPVPEFRPNHRVFSDSVEVSVVTGSPDTQVHYTVDGSIPTVRSPLWSGALKLTETKTLRAIAVKEGFRPSGVATARFLRDRLPPKIVGPAEPVLHGRVGKPLEIRFVADTAEPVTWRLAAHYRPEQGLRFQGGLSEFGGLAFDPVTATLDGIPTRSFVYTLQVQAAWQAGERADVRTYVLHVAE